MLPGFIIEQIRERQQRRERTSENQPTLELPLPMMPRPTATPPDSSEEKRGVEIIQL